MSGWDNIKQAIVREVQDVFEEPNAPKYDLSLDEGLDLFKTILEYKLGEKELDGISDAVFSALKDMFCGSVERGRILSTLEELATSVEPYLKKILFLTDQQTFQRMAQDKGHMTFMPVIRALRLQKNRENFHQEEPEQLHGAPHFAEHLCRSYRVRNQVHLAQDWSNREIATNLNSIVVIYLYATFEYSKQLQVALSRPEILPYLQDITAKYQKWHRRFVHIEGKEETYLDFEDIDLYAIEADWDEFESKRDEEEFDLERDKEENEEEEFEAIRKERRKGRIADLRKDIPQLVILGASGTGKTTSLQYLAYTDGQPLIYTPKVEQKYPVYAELRYYTADDTLMQFLQSGLNIPFDTLKRDLEKGRLMLFLDGLNEIIEPVAVSKVRVEIQNLLRRFPCVHCIISSRPQSYNNEFRLPTFMLQPLEDKQILEFLKKNFSSPQEGEQFYQVLQKHPKLFQMSRNPLILRLLVQVGEATKGNIPENKGKLLWSFMDWIFRREKQRNPSFDETKVKLFLAYLAYQTRMKQSVGFSKATAIDLLVKRANEVKQDIKTDEFLRQMTDLDILEESGSDRLSFAHEMYQEYFAAEDLLRLSEMGLNIIDELVKQENWEEPIVLYSGLCRDRDKVVKNIVTSDSLLAAKCITSSSRSEPELYEVVAAGAEKDAEKFADAEISGKGTLALVELEEFERWGKIISNVTRPTEIHKKAIAEALQKASLEQIFRILELLKSYGNIQLMIFVLDSIKETYEIKNRKEGRRVVALCSLKWVSISARVLSIFKVHHIESFGFSINNVVKECLEREEKRGTASFLTLASRLIEQHGLEDEFPIHNLIEKCLERETLGCLTLASRLIEQHRLENVFPICALIEKCVEKGTLSYLTLASQLIEQYGLEDEFPIRVLIEKCVEKGTLTCLTLASQLTEQHGLGDEFLSQVLIEKCVERGTTNHIKFASSLIKKYDFNLDFIRALIKKCLVEGGYNALFFACKLIKNYNLNNEFPVIAIMDIEPGMVLSGFVNRKFEHGVFVVIKVMKEHVTAYGSEFVQAKDLSIGQEVRVRITEVDLERRIVKGTLESAE